MAVLPPKGFFGATSEFDTRNWTALEVPAEIEYADLFDPTFWRHHAAKFRKGNLIRMRRVDGAWDVQLNVVASVQGGLQVELWPKMPDATAAQRAAEQMAAAIQVREVNGRPVPRVEHTPATKWRVIGLDGNEVSRGYETKRAAEDAMRTYAATLGREIAA